jgi:YebC/PmpR family DNA-binding regulatory protein
VATREGGGDPESNPRLRLAMDRANAASMPKDNIERAIKKATGELEGVSYESIRYEGYGPGGVAVMVDCLTDNRNRTVAAVRHAFSKHGGNLGTDGSVAYLFEKTGVIEFAPGADEDRIMEVALEGGADDVISNEDGSIEVLTQPEAFESTRDALKSQNLGYENAEITQRPSTSTSVDVDTGRQVLKFLDVLEDLDDTQDVWSNADIPADSYE